MQQQTAHIILTGTRGSTMAVELKSGNSTDLGTVDPASKALRVTNYDTNGNVVDLNVPDVLTCNDVTVVNNDIINSLNVSAYAFVSLQLTGTWVGTVQFEGSNDNGTFDSVVCQDMGEALVPYVSATTNTGIYKIPTSFKYLRVRVTSYTSGTVEGEALAYKIDSNTGQISAIGTVDLAAGSATIGNVGLNAGSAVVGKVGLDTGANLIGSVRCLPASADTLLSDFFVGVGGNLNGNSRVIRGQATTLRSLVMSNYTAGARHVKIFDTAVTPVAGEGTPILVVSLAASGTIAFPLPAEGLSFANGLSMTMTLGPANNDTTSTATGPDFTLVSIFT